MLRLAEEGPATAQELETALNLKTSAVHKYVVNLRSDGYVDGRKGGPTSFGRPPFEFFITDEGIDALVESLSNNLADIESRLAMLDDRHRRVPRHLSASSDR
ncbi:MAG: hypothetical protein JWL72_1446 [Ilumatobacteraceae bacterium]|nr:hypothetical protein [Ilumatobacteraceae bacterium]